MIDAVIDIIARFARQRRLAAALSIALAAVMFVSLNLAANTGLRGARLDLTANGQFTLAPGTRNILSKLKEPVTLRFFYSEEVAAEFPVVRAYAERVRDLLTEYRIASNGQLIIEEIDPQPFTPEEDRAAALGMEAAAVQTGEQIYFGIAGSNLADGKEAIPFLSVEREAYLEYDLSALIARLSALRKPRLGVISNLPLDVGAGGAEAAMQGRGQPYAIYQQLLTLFDIAPLAADIDRVPGGIDALLLVHPRALDEKTLYALDQFVMRGGRVIAFVDPISEIAQSMGTSDTGAPLVNAASDLWLLKAWGAAYNKDEVVLDRGRAQRVQYGRGARNVVSYPVWLALRKDGGDFDQSDLVTAGLNRLNLGSVGHFAPIEGATAQFTPLIQSSAESMLMSAEMLAISSNPDDLMRQFLPANERYTLAARISGPMNSAFPEGAPKTQAPAAEGAEAPAPLPAHLASTQDAAIILVADSDLFDDRFWLNGEGGAPDADNLAFVAGAVETMLGASDLAALRARAPADRPFTVVEDLRRAAELRFLKEEQDLNARIAETQDKLRALEREAPAGAARTELTPAQAEELERFRAELAEMRTRLREVQANLRAGINKLGGWLAFVNMAAVPILLVLTVLGLAAWRRWRPIARKGAPA